MICLSCACLSLRSNSIAGQVVVVRSLLLLEAAALAAEAQPAAEEGDDEEYEEYDQRDERAELHAWRRLFLGNTRATA
jgi:hypothetical protein